MAEHKQLKLKDKLSYIPSFVQKCLENINEGVNGVQISTLR